MRSDDPGGVRPRDVVVRLSAVTKRFGDVVAVDDLSLDIEQGEFFSLLGPSGCGKTTTLRMIGGFDQPDAGAISLGGVDVSHLPPHRRNVNTVFQSYALFPHLNVFDNVAYGLRRAKVPVSELRRRVGEALELVALPGLDARRPSQLSGGQQQRVALARALVNRPQVLLLDEPLGALDLKLRTQMQLELKRIQHEVGITFLYVTHDQDEAMTMSNRLAVMRAGRIEQTGAPREVYDRPATAFVASFLGASNLLRVASYTVDGSLARVTLAGGACVRAPASALESAHGPLSIGVRPEKIRVLSAPMPANGDNRIDGVLTETSFTGVSTRYTVTVPGDERLTVYAQNIGHDAPDVGDPVVLTWRPEHTFALTTDPEGEPR